MAITTTNSKLAIMELGQVWEPGLPMSPGTLGQDDQQQLLWGYPGILWATAVAGAGQSSTLGGRWRRRDRGITVEQVTKHWDLSDLLTATRAAQAKSKEARALAKRKGKGRLRAVPKAAPLKVPAGPAADLNIVGLGVIDPSSGRGVTDQTGAIAARGPDVALEAQAQNDDEFVIVLVQMLLAA